MKHSIHLFFWAFLWRKKSTLRSQIHNCSIPRSLARSPLTPSALACARATSLHMVGENVNFKHKNKDAVTPTLYSIAKPNFEYFYQQMRGKHHIASNYCTKYYSKLI